MSARILEDLVTRIGGGLAASVGGTLPGWDRVASAAKLVAVKRDVTVYEQGGDHPYIYFIVKGLLRATANRGNDVRILGFARPNEIDAPRPILPTAWARMATNVYGNARPSVRAMFQANDHGLVACMPSILVRFDADPVLELISTEPAWTRLALTISSYHLASRGARMHDFLTLTPSERYEKVLLEEPDVVKAVSQRDLAFLLGITPESLSRISSRARQRQRTNGTNVEKAIALK